MSESGKPQVTVNKIGGENMSQLGQVKELAQFLKGSFERPVLVVSAFKGVTNKLVAALEQLNGKDYGEDDVIEAFRVAREEVLAKCCEFLQNDTDASEEIVRQFDVVQQAVITHKQTSNVLCGGEVSFKIYDQVMALGEDTAKYVLGRYLNKEGIASRVVDSPHYHNGEDEASFHECLQNSVVDGLRDEVKAEVEDVLILGGHVSDTPRGITKEIGRSYTDTVAVHVALALKKLGVDVSKVALWKSVDGLATADARLLEEGHEGVLYHRQVSYEELIELAVAGSSVVQAQALMMAQQAGLRMEFNNMNKMEQPGTVINAERRHSEDLDFKFIHPDNNVDVMAFTVPGLAIDEGIELQIAEIYRARGIHHNHVIKSGTTLNFVFPLPSDKAEKEQHRREIAAANEEIERLSGGKYNMGLEPREDLAVLSMIGHELRDKQAILARMLMVVAAVGANIVALDQTSSQLTVPVILTKEHAAKAFRALHRYFIERDSAYVGKIIEEWSKIVQADYDRAAYPKA